MRRVSWLVFSVLGAFSFLAVSTAIVRSDRPAGDSDRSAAAIGTAFTYQGNLTDGGGPANGSYDFIFRLFDDVTGGDQVGQAIAVEDHAVVDGRFTVLLDFERGIEPLFNSSPLWLEIQVRPGADTGPHSTLSPRQPLSPTPYAVYASRAEWQGLQNVPAGFADGKDDDTAYLAGTGVVLSGTTFAISPTYQLPQNCSPEQISRWNGSAWVCDADADVLASLGCLSGQVPQWSGSTWTCDADDDLLDSLSCAPGEIVKWSGAVWECRQDEVGQGGGGGDITGVYAGEGLIGGGPSGEVTLTVAFEGAGLADTAARSDHDHDATYYTESELGTPGGALVHWSNLDAVPADLADGDDDALSTLICADGQVAKWDDAAGEWDCAADVDTDTDTTYSAGTGLSLSSGAFAITTTYRLPQSCTAGQLASWNGSDWWCVDPTSGTDGWSLTGNAGTSPGMNFLGTTDDQTLELRVNGQRALLLEPGAASPNFIAGYSGNSALGPGATVGGGGRDLAVNQAGGAYSTVDGGAGNQATGFGAVVGGGEGNSAADSYAVVGGGAANDAGGNRATIGGGDGNVAAVAGATVGGGQGNIVSGAYGVVAGGASNVVTATQAAVGGGYSNMVFGEYGTIGGGGPSDLGNPTTSNNRVYDEYGVVSGGGGNVAGDDDGDTTSAPGATVGGGEDNSAGAGYATVAGGFSNAAGAYGAVVGGGVSNSASANYVTLGGGSGNSSSAQYATIAGGSGNSAGTRASVGGGWNNAADGPFSTAGGGRENVIGGNYGTIPGGYQNQVSDQYGFAAGHQAQAQHQGSFVWSDSSGGLSSSGPDQFLIDADGGVGIGAGSPAHLLATNPSLMLSVDGRAEILGGELVARGAYTVRHENALQEPSAIDVVGDTLYVTSNATNTLTLLDISDPDNPVYISHTASDMHGPVDVEVVGGLAYVASHQNNRLVILDVSDPFNLKALESTNINLVRPQAVEVAGNRAYVATVDFFSSDRSNNGLAIFDVSDPRQILPLAFTNDKLDGASDVFVSGDYAYVTSYFNDRLVTFNIADTKNITASGFIHNLSALDAPMAIEVRGNYAFVAAEGSNTLTVLDISDPRNPVLVDGVATALTHPVSLFISGDYAYMAYAGEPMTADNCGLAVFDISDPAEILTLFTINMGNTVPGPEKPVAIHGSGEHIYVANEGHDTLAIYDVNQLNAPAIRTGTLLVDHLEAFGDAQVDNNLDVSGGLNVGPRGALIEGQLSVAGRESNYILGDLSLGAAGLTNPGEDEILQTYPTHQLDVHGAARFRINDEHSLIMGSPPEKGAFFDFTSNEFGAYYSPTARIYFEVPDPYTGTTHTTEMEILTKSASDPDMRPRMTIGEEVYIYNTGGAPGVQFSTTISFTKSGDVLPGVDGAYLLGDSENRWQAVYAVQGTIQTSDGRWKENIAELDVGLEEVNRLRPVSFSWIDKPEDGQHYGLIAQEVAEVLPEIVDGGGQNKQPLGMNYAEVVPVLVNAVQEQQAQIQDQADQIAALEARLAAMEGATKQGDAGPFDRLPWLAGLVILGAVVVYGRRRLGGLT